MNNSALFIALAAVCIGVQSDRTSIRPCADLNNSNNNNSNNMVQNKSIFLWSIEKNSTIHGYLFGTIHVPFTEVWHEVSEKVKEAFLRSYAIVFELDLYNQQTIERLTRCKNIPGDGTVKDYLSPKLYLRLKHYMKNYRNRLEHEFLRNNLTVESKKRFKYFYESIAGGWERRRPVWLLFFLYQLTEKMNTNREQTPMLDLFMAQYALELNKKLYAIETAAEQCNPLRSVRFDQLLFAINYTLSYLEYEVNVAPNSSNPTSESQSGIGDLIRSYKCGMLDESMFSTDSKRFISQGFSISTEHDLQAQQINDNLREDIIDRRNVRMADRIAKLLRWKVPHHYFFALGAGHFIGRNSVLSLLAKHGFKTNAVTEDDEITIEDYETNRRTSVFNELWVKDTEEHTAVEIVLSVDEISSAPAQAIQCLRSPSGLIPSLIIAHLLITR